MIALNAKNKLQIVTGELTEPNGNSNMKAIWERTNDMIISWILNTFTDQIDGHKIYQLTNEITQLKQENASVEVYYQKLKGYWDGMDALESPYTCTCTWNCENGKINGERDQRKRLIQFLMGLDECYSNVRGQILLMQPMPTAAKAYGMVRQEEKQKEHGLTRLAISATLSMQSNNTTRWNTSRTTTAGRSSFKKGIFCANCTFEGHTKEECYKLVGYPIGYPLHAKYKPPQKVNYHSTSAPTKSINSVTGNDVSTSADMAMSARMDQLQNQQNQVLLMMQSNRGDQATTSIHRITSHISAQKYRFIASIINHLKDAWIVDSGAKDHVSSSLNNIHNIHQYTKPILVTLPNGHNTQVTSYGSDHHKRIAHGTLFNGLYLIQQEKECTTHSINQAMTPHTFNSTKAFLWHSRLGHSSFNVLKQIDCLSSVIMCSYDINDCSICPLAKQHKLPFPDSTSHANTLFDLIHIDIWGPYKHTTMHDCKHVTFNESIFPFQTSTQDIPPHTSPIHHTHYESHIYSPPSTSTTTTNKCNTTPEPNITQASPANTIPEPDIPQSANSTPPSNTSTTLPTATNSTPNDHQNHSPTSQLSTPHINSTNETSTTAQSFRRTSTRTHTIPAKFNDYHHSIHSTSINSISKFRHTKYLNYNNIITPTTRHLICTINNIVEPHTYIQEFKNEKWVQAMNKELQALQDNNTWVITTLPPNKTPVGNKWVYRIKLKADGSIERYKARLVVKGFTQREGTDYTETFAHVAKMVTVRALVAIATHHHWNIEQLDVNNAVLHGDLNEEVYMSLPQGYTQNVPPNSVCKLLKSLYGLKQANRQWFIKLTTFLQENGFTQSYVDSSLFTYKKGTNFLALVIYVDNLILKGNNTQLISEIKTKLDKSFSIKYLGSLNYYPGNEFLRNKNGMTMTQRKYALELLHTAGILDVKPSNVPIDPTLNYLQTQVNL
ncbi:uncharacterized protein [Rutidosis leptorrhynchoides]|uniref:uncharacterized protein n=1 Tax=Rutidosis leptorrhynchoides TaxID=125765 RepID=UPI003A992F1C